MLQINDNCWRGKEFLRDEVKDLAMLQGKSIKTLCSEYENLLVFPFSVDNTEDRIGNSTIFTLESVFDNPDAAIMRTGNIVGCIGKGDANLRISSRFEQGTHDYFMQYMLSKVLHFNIFDLNYSSNDEDVLNFLMALFPVFLHHALAQGIYREYRRHEYNDTRLRGTVDVAKFLKEDVPFTGNVAYVRRDYDSDNSVTQLVQHTIGYMMTTTLGRGLLEDDERTAQDVKKISSVTPTYNQENRRKVIMENLRPKVHPFFTEYYPLQRLCLQILREEKLRYGEADDEVHGILFDGAWLWEEYLSTILEPMGFQHPHNKQGKGGFFIYEDNTGYRMPDFYRKDFVLDAKYKRLEEKDRISELEVSDQNQMIVYLKHLKVQEGGFVCPLNRKEQLALPQARLKSGHEHIAIYGIQIPDTADDFVSFSEMMRVQEESLKDRIETSID